MTDSRVPHPEQALTIGEISRRTGRERHQIEYIIRKLGVEPALRAGIARVFDPRDVERIARELNRIRKAQKGAA